MPDLDTIIPGGQNNQIPVVQNPDPASAIQATTGLDMSKLISSFGSSQASDPVPEPQISSESMRILSEEEMMALNQNNVYTKVDLDQEAIRGREAKIDQAINSQNDSVMAMLDGALSEEEARVQRHEAALQDPEKAKEITGGTTAGDKVRYAGEVVPRAAEKKTMMEVLSSAYANEELTPNYEYDEPAYNVVSTQTDTPAPAKVGDDPEEIPTEMSAYREYLKGLAIVNIGEESTDIAKMARAQAVTTIPANREAFNTMNDQAFLNAINKFKKDNFSVYTVPLPNSGFTVDVVGTGVVDLLQLYTDLDENTVKMEYEIEKMKVIIRNVVNTTPKIRPEKLKDMIHFQDYKMMAFAHVCATLREVEVPANCATCGKAFRISSKPASLLLNKEKFDERLAMIRTSGDPTAHSLLTNNQKISTSNGFEVILGHPSYAEVLQLLNQVKVYAANLDPLEVFRFKGMIDTLFMVRHLYTPNGIATANIFQNYMAFKMISEEDRVIIDQEIANMSKDIIIPEFGVNAVTCPHCNLVNTNIRYESLEDMVFTHTQISRILTTPES